MFPDEYQAFVADVAANGIIDPLDITRRGVVLDGRHRLQAALETGLPRVPVRVVAPTDEVDYLVRRAVMRRQLTQGQRAAIIVALHAHHGIDVATLLTTHSGRTRDALAGLAGVCPRLIQDAHLIHQRDPDLFTQVRDGHLAVHRAASRIRRTHRDAQLTTPRLPRGRFEVILADPPWQLGNPHSTLAPEQHYPTLPLTDITNLAVPAANDAILFLWAVSALLPEALDVIRAWGFTYKTNACWVKQSIGPGVWLRNRHELLLIAVRGSWSPPDPTLRVDSVITAKRRRHSQKPDQTYERIETMYPRARRLELFARTRRAGWTSWGNQLPDAQERVA
jgi:N6-adenosine-specific RNA methylase IME4